jgi:prepilin-type N-terminal cleavage/methylation domain-containing protein
MYNDKTTLLQKGYTLIEMLLYIAIVGIMLVPLTYFFGMTTEARVKAQSIAEVDDQATAAMDNITQIIRNAYSITTPAAAASGSSLTLVVPTTALSPAIFSLNGTTLQVKEGTAANVALTSNDIQVSNLTFKNLTRSGTSGIVQISFTVTRVNSGGRNEFDYSKTFTSSAEIGW